MTHHEKLWQGRTWLPVPCQIICRDNLLQSWTRAQYYPVIVSNPLPLIVFIIISIITFQLQGDSCTYSTLSFLFTQLPKIYLQYFCWKKKIGDTLFSEADCSKLPPLINNTERHRESERHRERQILTCFNWNNISHHTEVSYHSHQHGPVSLCASACPPFPHIFAHSSLPPISSGQSVA